MKRSAGLFILSVALAIMVRAQEQPKTSPLRIPRIGDETSVSSLKTYAADMKNRAVVLVGGLMTENYYNWRFSDAANTHVALRFRELTEEGKSIDTLSLYVDRNSGSPLVEKVLENQKQGHGKAARVKVVATPRCFEAGKFNDVAEILDWQFFDKSSNRWGPWERERILRHQADNLAETQRKALEVNQGLAKQREETRKAAMERALKFNQAAADRGEASGQFRMGERYFKGEGVNRDLAKAREYLAKAAAQGYPEAVRLLDEVRKAQ